MNLDLEAPVKRLRQNELTHDAYDEQWKYVRDLETVKDAFLDCLSYASEADSERIKRLVSEIVYTHLAEWGTSARVIGHSEDVKKDESLRELLNGCCDPLIDDLTKNLKATAVLLASGKVFEPYK